jgi:hypothetical protein
MLRQWIHRPCRRRWIRCQNVAHLANDIVTYYAHHLLGHWLCQNQERPVYIGESTHESIKRDRVVERLGRFCRWDAKDESGQGERWHGDRFGRSKLHCGVEAAENGVQDMKLWKIRVSLQTPHVFQNTLY